MNINYFKVDFAPTVEDCLAMVFMHPYAEHSTEPITQEVEAYLNEGEDLVALTEKKRQSLSDEDFYHLFEKFAFAELDEKDLLKVLSLKYHKNFCGIRFLKTNMVKDFLFLNQDLKITWQMPHFAYYRVFYTDDAAIDWHKYYSYQEVNDLILDHKVVLFEEIFNIYIAKGEKMAKYKTLPMLEPGSLTDNAELRLTTIKYLRKHLSCKELAQGLAIYFESIKEQIENLSLTDDKFQYEIDYVKKCLADLESQGHVQKLERLLTTVHNVK